MMRRTTVLATAAAAVAALTAPVAAWATPAATEAVPSTTAAESVGAPAAWAAGYDGTGVGVALVDTGISPHPELPRLAGVIDVSGSGRVTDGHGHGTFLAGLIAGQRDPRGPLGVAPGAHLVGVKVADAEGRTSLDRVLAGLAAVRHARDAFGIRVVVLALGGPADDVADPLEEALEQLWSEGLVVVVASGNDGDGVTEPGISSTLLTVGAVDDAGTTTPEDDSVPAWSGRGQTRTGDPKPDVLAPGRSVVSVRIPGSSADRENPTSRIDGRWFRGSGTSMSAAVTGGAAALLLDARPELSPDQVKSILMASSRPVDGSTAGAIDLEAALVAARTEAERSAPALSPTGTSPDASGETPVVWDGKSWIGKSWIGKSWIGKSWIDQAWEGKSWIGKSWIELTWDGKSWIGKSWIDAGWDGKSWIGKSWIDAGWDGKSWIGKSWIGSEWTGRSWSASSWD